MDQKTNPIQPPPSVDDLLALGTDSRVGQVDFATRLVAVPDQDPREERAAQQTTATTVQPRQRVVEAVPEPEDEAVVAPEPEKPVRTPKPAARTTKPRPAPKDAARTTASKAAARKQTAAKPARQEPALEPAASPAVTPPSVVPPIMPIASLSGDTVTAAPDPSPAETTVSEAVLPEPAHPDPAAPDASHLGATVQAVADAAIERLRDAENATLQHLAALEAEAARRAELLTAQAELDAELIRITARREAHAIISAARTQAGLGAAQSSRDSRQLAEISDAVSRFAESMESTLSPIHSTRGDG